MTQDSELFKLWYVEPVHALEQLPGGHSAFIALATACFLYERYACAVLKARGKRADKEAKLAQLAQDFEVDDATACAFWEVIRDGLLHQGMPKQRNQGAPLPQWAFFGSYPPMALEKIGDRTILKVHPWKFTHRVLDIWQDSLELLAKSDSFPWASIGAVPA
jgi:hypothetical protein